MNKNINSIFYVIIAHVCFTTQDMSIKLISGDYALHQVIFLDQL